MKVYLRTRPAAAVQWTGDNYSEVRAIEPDCGLTVAGLVVRGQVVELWQWIVDGVVLDTDTFRRLYSDSLETDLAYIETSAMVKELGSRRIDICVVALAHGQRPELLLRGNIYTLSGLLQHAGITLQGKMLGGSGDVFV